MSGVWLQGAFDNLSARDVRLLHEASRLGSLSVYVWDDTQVAAQTGMPPRFPLEERRYLLESIRYVTRVITGMPADEGMEGNDAQQLVVASALEGWPMPAVEELPPTDPLRKKVIVTGCFDWLHSGHVRFFEECAELGDLYVAVGNDANIRHLKGEGHPLYSEAQRRYMVQAVRQVHRALLTSGMGWMDAEPEIAVIRPDIYAVNEDGDKPDKRTFCAAHGLEYVVLKRLPRPGLPPRSSTDLRGF